MTLTVDYYLAPQSPWTYLGHERFAPPAGSMERTPTWQTGSVLEQVSDLDGRPIETTQRALLAAVGSAENRGMKWNAPRTSVGRDWGTGPAEVNGIATELSLPRGGAKVFALDGRGQRLTEVAAADGAILAIGFRIRPSKRFSFMAAS